MQTAWTRDAFAQALGRDAEALSGCIRLIRARVPWAAWTEGERGVLAAACRPAGGNAAEDGKAAALRWHLFRRDCVPFAAEPCHGRAAERVRADLVGLVPLGAGRHLLPALAASAPAAPSEAGGGHP